MKKHTVVITGGAGFIGTQVADTLTEQGHRIIVVDRDIRGRMPSDTLIECDYEQFFIRYRPRADTVIHLAADHMVEQSMYTPDQYYENNVVKMKTMLDIMVSDKIPNIIFSSSGNTYGRQGLAGPLKEDVMFYDPENPYASSKVAGELLIKDYARAYGLNYVTFRYFNAAGADPDGRFGYTQNPATHVVPMLCKNILQDVPFTVNGTSYDTPDGTCVRDYVHVKDLATAHAQALGLFTELPVAETINLGGGSSGVSVKDLVVLASKVTNTTPVVIYGPARPGDPARLTANITKARRVLGWTPHYTIRDIISHAWAWECKSQH